MYQIDQAERQIRAAGGTPIKWEISSSGGAIGIKKLFQRNGINIKVEHVAQEIIIPKI